jgi:hypothetical protein
LLRKDKIKVHSICKACSSEVGKEYTKTAKGKESKKKRAKRYLENGGKEVARQWVLDNREWLREYLRAYNRTEKGRASIERRTKSEKGRATSARGDHKKRLRKRLVPNTLTAEEWAQIKKQFKYRCIYCGEKKPLTHEHIVPLSRGGSFTKENILPACKNCNSKRGNRKMLLELLSEPCYPKVACICIAM